eukprot:CAMPEP_0184860550 /NCGR_PEP_ID=MMETSP0580-20130426/5416_1 /TAXON_ID=1118495 /ORGANISM="Dactyliosolen fragilissimus" /LENGTH=429 /DNA_ID=CAMNT_0027357693 /DNA_START=164 /DNA_END=1453 /DNA_ORIENTATION=-
MEQHPHNLLQPIPEKEKLIPTHQPTLLSMQQPISQPTPIITTTTPSTTTTIKQHTLQDAEHFTSASSSSVQHQSNLAFLFEPEQDLEQQPHSKPPSTTKSTYSKQDSGLVSISSSSTLTLPTLQTRRSYIPMENSVETLETTIINRKFSIMSVNTEDQQLSRGISMISSLAEYDGIRHLPINHPLPTLINLLSSPTTESTASQTVSDDDDQSFNSFSSAKSINGANELLSLAQAIKTRTFLSLLLSNTFLSFSFTTFYEQLPAYIEGQGFSSQDATDILSLTGLAMIMGNMTLGFVVDWIGPIRMLKVLLVHVTVLMFLWPHCTNLQVLRVVAFLYGFGTTVTFTMPLIILADVFGDVAPHTILHLVGISNAISTPGYLFGPSITGHLYDIYGTYVSGSIFTGVTTIFSSLALMFILDPMEQRVRLGVA